MTSRFCARCGSEELTLHWCALDTAVGRLWFCRLGCRTAWLLEEDA